MCACVSMHIFNVCLDKRIYVTDEFIGVYLNSFDYFPLQFPHSLSQWTWGAHIGHHIGVFQLLLSKSAMQKQIHLVQKQQLSSAWCQSLTTRNKNDLVNLIWVNKFCIQCVTVQYKNHIGQGNSRPSRT